MWIPLVFFLLHLSIGSASPPFLEDTEDLDFGLLDSPVAETFPETSLSYRLPETILPSHYHLYIEPNFDNETYSGSVQIEFTVLEETNVIVIHRRQITIDDQRITITCNSNTSYNVLSANGSETDDHWFYNIQLSANLTVFDICTLNIGYFESDFNRDANNGFYMGTYRNEDEVIEAFAMTKFEPVHARRAFPCFDEPALKATFTISINRPADYVSEANTPLVSSTVQSDGKYLDVFNETVSMSTYLVAWVVSKFGYTERLERQRVFGRATEVRDGRANYTLDVGYRSLLALEEYTNISYALDKMDQLAVPDGFFTSGAMENWGLVSYREAYLFYYGNRTTVSYRQFMNTVISHEFSHQWFGNLVSPLWWSYIWLNEGFASYFEYYIVSVLEPEWEMMEQFIIKDTQYAMIQDAGPSIRHMNQDAQTPTAIAALFDRVAYDKSGAVIYMLETIVSFDVFRRGLNIYLNNRRFSDATPSDLYAGVQAAVNETGYIIADNLGVAEIMETWSENPGYPVLRVERNYAAGSVTFSQSRFLLRNSTEITNRLWYIPINTATASNHNFSDTRFEFFLTQQSATRNLNIAASDWLLVNKGERGYYRVNYDETNWNLLANYLNSERYNHIPKTSRAQLINDAFNLARSGRLNYSIPLNLLALFQRDTDYIPYYALSSALEYVDLVLAGTRVYDDFKTYVRSLLEVAYNEVGVIESSTDAHVTQFLRPEVVTWACKYGLASCRNDALNVLNQWLETDENPLTATIEQSVLCGAIRTANISVWQSLYRKYLFPDESAQRPRILNALACSENSTIIRVYLDRAILSTSGIPRGDRSSVFSNIYTKGLLQLETELDFFDENLEAIITQTDVSSVSTVISGIGNYLTEPEHLTKLQDIQSRHSDRSSLFTTAINRVRANIEWNDLNRGDIISWVSALNPAAPATPPSNTVPPTVPTPPVAEDGGSKASAIFSNTTFFILTITVIIGIH